MIEIEIYKFIEKLDINNLDYNKINDFINEKKINHSQFYKELLIFLSAFIKGGKYNEEIKGDKIKFLENNYSEIKKGINIEKEHIDINNKYNKIIAMRIALDHITEDKDYYNKLSKMNL